MNENVDFPFEHKYSNEELVKKYWKCNYTSVKDTKQQYSVILPNDVKPTSVNPKVITNTGIQNVGIYQGEISKKGYLEVHFYSQLLNYEIDPMKWIIKIIEDNGEKVVKQKIIESNTGIYSDIVAYKTIENSNETIMARYTVSKNYSVEKKGAYYSGCKVVCDYKNYEKLKFDIFHISSSWFFIEKANWGFAEKLNVFKSNDFKEITFLYPTSWKLKEATDNNSNLSRFVFIQKINNNSSAAINLYCINNSENNDTDSEKIVDSLTSRFNSNQNIILDLKPSELVHKRYTEIIDTLVKVEGYIKYKDNTDKKDKIIIYIFCIEKKWYYFELVGTSAKDNYLLSAIQDRALSIMINSFNNLEYVGKDYEIINENTKDEELPSTSNGKSSSLKFKLS